MIMFGQKSQEIVGLDIGSYSLKVCAIKKEGDKNILTSYNIKRIPTEGGKTENLIQLVNEAFSEVDITPEEANFSLSGQSVIVRFMDFPKMSKEQLDSAMVYEAEKYIPFNVNEVMMDTAIIGKSTEAGQMRIALAAVKNDYLDSRVKLAEKLGIHINILDVDAFAIFNAFTNSGRKFPEDKATALVDFGHKQTNILVSIKDTPCFMRQVQIGGQDVTNSIAEDLGVTPVEAEDMKTKDDADVQEKISHSVGVVLEELVKEMQLSFGYFENRYSEHVGEFYCSGGLVHQKGVLGYIQNKLGEEVKKWDPVEGLELAENLSKEDVISVGPQLAVSIGLALRG